MDFQKLAAHGLTWPPALEAIIKDGYPQEQVQVPIPHPTFNATQDEHCVCQFDTGYALGVQVPFQGLRYPESVYFTRTCTMRNKRLEGVNIDRMIERVRNSL